MQQGGRLPSHTQVKLLSLLPTAGLVECSFQGSGGKTQAQQQERQTDMEVLKSETGPAVPTAQTGHALYLSRVQQGVARRKWRGTASKALPSACSFTPYSAPHLGSFHQERGEGTPNPTGPHGQGPCPGPPVLSRTPGFPAKPSVRWLENGPMATSHSI